MPVTAGAVMTSLHQISGMASDAMAYQPRGVHLQPGRGVEVLACNRAEATELSFSSSHFQ